MSNNRFHYTARQKLQILEEVKECELKQIQNDYGITKEQIMQWTDHREELLRVPEPKPSSMYSLHPGPQLKCVELYIFLYKKVKRMRVKKQAVSHFFLIQLAIEQQPSIQDLTPSGQRSLIDRFMKFSKLSIRTITSRSSGSHEQIPQEEAAQIENFRNEFQEIIRNQGIQSEDILNMDQTGLNYQTVPKKTIEIIGSQHVPVSTFNGEKKRVTIFSLISYSGRLFRQFVIFKGDSRC